MAQKRFQLTTDAKNSTFVKAGVFKFRVSYEKIEGGRKTIYGQKNAPIFSMTSAGILGTENPTAQDRLEKIKLPNKTTKAGVTNPFVVIFEDVTATTTSEDVTVDMDPYFT